MYIFILCVYKYYVYIYIMCVYIYIYYCMCVYICIYDVYIYIYVYDVYICIYMYTFYRFYLCHTLLVSYPMVFPESYVLIFSHHSHNKPSCRRCSRSRNGTSMATTMAMDATKPPRFDQLEILGDGLQSLPDFPYLPPFQ